MNGRKYAIITIGLVAILIIAIMGIVGNSDYEEAKREEAFYCHMVAAGYWPDYKGVYALCQRRLLKGR